MVDGVTLVGRPTQTGWYWARARYEIPRVDYEDWPIVNVVVFAVWDDDEQDLIAIETFNRTLVEDDIIEWGPEVQDPWKAKEQSHEQQG